VASKEKRLADKSLDNYLMPFFWADCVKRWGNKCRTARTFSCTTFSSIQIVVLRSVNKGLEPKLHDLALSMGKNKTLNLKDVTSLKLLKDIMLLISISSFV
jgi:hypothetical protein